MARRPTDGMESESLYRQDVERRLRALESGTRLQSASIGAGGITVKDGGQIVVEGGNITVTDDGEILIEGGDTSIRIAPADVGGSGPGVSFGAGAGTLGSIYGETGGAGNRLTVEGGDGGTSITLLGDRVSLRIDGNVTVLQADDADMTNPIELRVNGALKRVTQGGADSGGSGFRVLRVPN